MPDIPTPDDIADQMPDDEAPEIRPLEQPDINNVKYPVQDAPPGEGPMSINDFRDQGFGVEKVTAVMDAGIYYFLIDGEWMPLRSD